MKHISENVIKHIIHVATFEMILLISTSRSTITTVSTAFESAVPAESSKATCTGISISGTCSTALIKCSMTELVIQFLLLRITQYRVRLRHFFEFLLRFFIPRIRVRMILLRQLTICSLYLFILCAL